MSFYQFLWEGVQGKNMFNKSIIKKQFNAKNLCFTDHKTVTSKLGDLYTLDDKTFWLRRNAENRTFKQRFVLSDSDRDLDKWDILAFRLNFSKIIYHEVKLSTLT